MKSDRNAAGIPERDRGGFVAKVQRKLFATIERFDLQLYTPFLQSPLNYPVYDHVGEVPRSYFYNPDLVVKKFLPERDARLYCVRYMEFLGDRVTCTRLNGKHPIVKRKNAEVVELDIEPHPEIVAQRNRLQFDYGKFDYVVVDGEAILLDANKTVGYTPSLQDTDEREKLRQYRAKGLYSFFEGVTPTQTR